MKVSGDDYQVTVTEDDPAGHDDEWTDAYLYERLTHSWTFFDARQNACFAISALAELCREADDWEEREEDREAEEDQLPPDPYKEFGVLRSDFVRPGRN